MHVRPKDYVKTEQGFYFAVVSEKIEENCVLAYLRYQNKGSEMQKLNTYEADQLVRQTHPEFIFHSQYADVDLHGIPVDLITHIFRPEETVAALLSMSEPDEKQRDAVAILKLLIDAGINKESLGITGSIMLDSHNANSDIDMVIYGRSQFHKARQLIKQALVSGKLKQLDEAMWQDAWQRRDCELEFDEYCAHELRKYNKCLSGSSKVDISMIPLEAERYQEYGPYQKLGMHKFVTRIVDDTYAYDFPARYSTDNNDIPELVAYTATYTGQAQQGELVEAAGFIEQDQRGKNRLLVGTSREARQEYIKLINENPNR